MWISKRRVPFSQTQVKAKASVEKSDLYATMGKRAESGTALTKACRHRLESGLGLSTIRLLLAAKASPQRADPCGQ